MAKKKKASGPNKSQAIRDYLQANPKAGPTEVCQELGKKGIKMTPALVSNVKRAMLGKKPGKKKVGRKAAGRPAAAGDTVSVNALLEARAFVEKAGSIANAYQALKTLERLS